MKDNKVVLVDREVAARRAFDAVQAMDEHGYSSLEAAKNAAASVRNLLPYCANPPSIAQVDGSLTREQVERAKFTAKSRGIDLETAQELVYLRDAAIPAAATAAPVEQSAIDLDPLEFWCDLVEVLGHPRPVKVNPVSVIAEAEERLRQIPPTKEHTDVTDDETDRR